MSKRQIHQLVTPLILWLPFAPAWAAGPTVSNVRSAQRPGSQLVDIDYDLADPDSGALTVTVTVSDNAGTSYTVPATSFTGAIGGGVTPGNGKRITWNAGVDWPNKFSPNVRFRVTASDDAVPPPPSGMALIPAGSFQMGDNFGDWPAQYGPNPAIPVHTVFVSAFYMDKTEVTWALWHEVTVWSNGKGYDLNGNYGGNATNHSVVYVRWFDVVKWCNARSEMEGRVPAYYTDAALTHVYKEGHVSPFVKWVAGYRLPTEAEWEKAARGGASGHRFPWSDSDTITHSRANYTSDSSYSYDVSPTRGYHPTYKFVGPPFISPAGVFAPNGYGLYDMAGNVFEWCWDWSGSYPSAAQSDPRGPASGGARVFRGGSWGDVSFYAGCANRVIIFSPEYQSITLGFRSALAPPQL